MWSPYTEIVVKRKRQGIGCVLGEISIRRPFGGEAVPLLAYSLELPWQMNAKSVSCIPTGRYPAFIREDGTRGWRVELRGVSNRTYIQIHAGNRPSEIDGCILPGLSIAGDNSVTSSRAAMKKLKAELFRYSNKPDILVVVQDPNGITQTPAENGAFDL